MTVDSTWSREARWLRSLETMESPAMKAESGSILEDDDIRKKMMSRGPMLDNGIMETKEYDEAIRRTDVKSYGDTGDPGGLRARDELDVDLRRPSAGADDEDGASIEADLRFEDTDGFQTAAFAIDSTRANIEKGINLDKLSKENFNLKLRIYYLEESLEQFRKGDESHDSFLQELQEHKILLDEKQQELDDRNNLLIKARTAIETLTTELDICRSQLEEQRAKRPVSPSVIEAQAKKAIEREQRNKELEAQLKLEKEELLTARRCVVESQDALSRYREESEVQQKLADQELRELKSMVKGSEDLLGLKSKEIDRINSDLEKAERRAIDSEGIAAELAETIAEIRAANQDLKNDYATLQKEVEDQKISTSERIDRQRVVLETESADRLGKLEKQLSQALDDCKNFQTSLAESEDNLSREKRRYADLLADLADMATLEQNARFDREKVSKLEENISALSQQVEESDTRRRVAESEKLAQVALAAQKEDALQKEINRLNEKLASMPMDRVAGDASDVKTNTKEIEAQPSADVRCEMQSDNDIHRISESDLHDLKVSFAQNIRAVEDKYETKLRYAFRHFSEFEERCAELENLISNNLASNLQNEQSAQRSLEHLRWELNEKAQESAERYEKMSSLSREKDIAESEYVKLRQEFESLAAELRNVQNNLEESLQACRSFELQLQESMNQKGILEENNRLLSLEVEDRAKRLKKENRARLRAQQKLDALKESLHIKQMVIDQLGQKTINKNIISKQLSTHRNTENELETLKAKVQNGENEERFKEIKPGTKEAGEYHGNIGSVTKKIQTALGENSETFSDVLTLASNLVQRTEEMIRGTDNPSRSLKSDELLHLNHHLTNDLLRLGRELRDLQQRILSYGNPKNHKTTVIEDKMQQNASLTDRLAIDPHVQNYGTSKNINFLHQTPALGNSYVGESDIYADLDSNLTFHEPRMTMSPVAQTYENIVKRLSKIKQELETIG